MFVPLLGLLSLLVAGSEAAKEQQPLAAAAEFDLIYQLKKAEIIPTVFNEFIPRLKLEVAWKHATAQVGNTVNPSKVQNAPDVSFVGDLPDVMLADVDDDDLPQFTLALTDPDAPSRDDPRWSEICHWLATDVKLSSAGRVHTVQRLNEVVPYKPPGPPKKTGKHRYVFAALVPANGTTAKLNLSKPGDRQHWGYDDERQGLRDWAKENGLTVVGANFIYSQNDKQ